MTSSLQAASVDLACTPHEKVWRGRQGHFSPTAASDMSGRPAEGPRELSGGKDVQMQKSHEEGGPSARGSRETHHPVERNEGPTPVSDLVPGSPRATVVPTVCLPCRVLTGMKARNG